MDWMIRAGYAKHDYIYSTFSKIWMEPRRVEYVACKKIIELKPIWGGVPQIIQNWTILVLKPMVLEVFPF
jgi:hypothetical protein